MSARWRLPVCALALALLPAAFCEELNLRVPKIVEEGQAFLIEGSGSGKATLYVLGPEQVIKREVQLGTPLPIAAGTLCSAGHYLAILVAESSTEYGSFDVAPASKPARLSFLAKPSRLPAGLRGSITGAVYVFDAYGNLFTAPTPVSFELSSPSGAMQKHIVATQNGSAWSAMDSTSEQGNDRFVARVGDIETERIVGQVPGDPCGLKMNARQSGSELFLSIDPVRDCNGNAVPDGTIVTFTQVFNGGQSTADVPLKRGIAEVKMASHPGATISVASGVVMGNQIRWEK